MGNFTLTFSSQNRGVTLSSWLIYIKISIAPDHRAIILGVKMAINKRVTGLWKFNNHLLKDQVFKTLVENSYPMINVKSSEVQMSG